MEHGIYESQTRLFQRRVFFEGEVDVKQGQACCYNRTKVTTETGETATDAFGLRDKNVALPTAANSLSFAGVFAENYSAKTGGRWVVINEPGSVCKVYTGETSLTLGHEVFLIATVTASNPGYFYSAGAKKGRGCARVLQTISAAGLVMAELMTGEQTGLVEVIKPVAAGGAVTLSKSGLTLIDGTDVVSAHVTNTLANGTYVGQRKSIKVSVLIGTSKNFVLTVTTGVQFDGATALATLTFNSANEFSELEWNGTHWKLIGNSGTTIA